MLWIITERNFTLLTETKLLLEKLNSVYLLIVKNRFSILFPYSLDLKSTMIFLINYFQNSSYKYFYISKHTKIKIIKFKNDPIIRSTFYASSVDSQRSIITLLKWSYWRSWYDNVIYDYFNSFSCHKYVRK